MGVLGFEINRYVIAGGDATWPSIRRGLDGFAALAMTEKEAAL